MAPSTTFPCQRALETSPKLHNVTILKPDVSSPVGGLPFKAGWSGQCFPTRKSVQPGRPQLASSQLEAICNTTLRDEAVQPLASSAESISASRSNAHSERLFRSSLCVAKATGPVQWSRRDATKVFYRPVRMPASREVVEDRGDGSGGESTAEIVPDVTSTDTVGTVPSLEHAEVIDNMEQSSSDAESTSSLATQPRRVRESSPWWKKNFSSVKRPRLEPDSETSNSVETDLESIDCETSTCESGDSVSVEQTRKPKASTSSGNLDDLSDENEELLMLRRRGKKGRVVVKYGKGKALLRSNDWKASGVNGQMGDPSTSGAWFPHSGVFEIEGTQVDAAYVMRALQGELAQNRIDRIAEVVAGRSCAVVPVVEALNNLANVSAVCRTAEALGCQSVHAIAREKARYKASGRVSAGSDKWLDLELWTDTGQCLRTLKKRGYRIAVTCMDQLGGGGETLPIHQLDWTIPTAVVLGNEMFGVTGEAKELADIGCFIPMGGFTDSFNIAHAAAILMYHAVMDRIERQGFHADLTSEQRDILTAEFYLRTNRTAESVVHRLLELEGAVLKKAPKGYVRSLVEAQGGSDR